MSKPSRCIFAIPTPSIDEVPKGFGSRLSQDYLNAWTALWDPRLIVAFNGVPEWRRGDTSGLDIEGSLIVCPDLLKTTIDIPLEERVRANQNKLLYSNCRSRAEVVSDVLEAIEQPSNTSPALLEDFYALGFVVFHVQVIARKLRYSSNLDWMVLSEQIVNASKASIEENHEEADRWLQAAFDSISQERDRYCSQQGNLIELVLTADTTFGESFAKQLLFEQAFTVYATSKQLKRLSLDSPSVWQHLVARLADESISIAGGCETELAQSQVSEMSILNALKVGHDSYRSLDIKPPATFMQFEPGIAASLPTLLKQFGYRGAIISPWSGGATPSKEHAKIRWQTHSEGPSIDCIFGHTIDAADAESMLQLSTDLSAQLDYHQVPTVVLAHWPNQACDAFTDLLNASKRTPALGRFMTADKYFANTAQPYWTDQFASNVFRLPLPKTGPEQNELHLRIIDGLKLATRAERLSSAFRLWNHVSSRQNQTETGSANVEISSATDQSKAELLQTIRQRVGQQGHYIVVNPANHPARYYLDNIDGLVEADGVTWIVASEAVGSKSKVIVDVPPFGFATFRAQNASTRTSKSIASGRPSMMQRVFGARPVIAQDDWTLANEFMEIQVDPKRGNLKSMYVASKRGNRLSARISIANIPFESQMKFEGVSFFEMNDPHLKIVENSKLSGSIECNGTVSLPDGQNIEAQIRYTLWKAARWVDVEVALKNVDISKCCAVWRTAWASEAATISAWQNGLRGKLCSPLQTTTELIEIDDAEYKIYLATRGLSAHRRMDSNMLVSTIPIQKDGIAVCKFTIGLDWPRPLETAFDLSDEPWVIPPMSHSSDGSKPSKPTNAWLSQCNAPNIRYSFVDPIPPVVFDRKADVTGVSGSVDVAIISEESVQPDEAFWFVETQGQTGTAKFQFVENVRCGWRVDFLGKEFDTLKVEGGQLLVPYKPWERSRVALCFDCKS